MPPLPPSPIILGMSAPPPAVIKRLQTLAQIAADLRHGKNFEITRLTMLKSLCSDQNAAARFALHIAKKTHERMEARSRSGRPPSEAQRRYQRLVGKAVRGMEGYLKRRTNQTKSALHDILSEIRDVQNEYERQRWGPVRIIHSREVLVAETALECVLQPWYSSVLGYQIAQQYAKRYNSRYWTDLIPQSAPMVEDIVEFWGRHFLGRGWRKKLTG